MRRLLLALLLTFAGPLQAGDVEAWLAKVAPALRDLDYQGTLVYLADGRTEAMQVFHRNDGGRERERLVSVSGPHREVVRDGDRVTCIGTGDTPAAYGREGGRWSPALALSEAIRLKVYRAQVAGSGRIAGHAARRIDIGAADGWRYGYRLWLAEDSGLPLRVDLLDGAGAVVEQVAFTDLRFARPRDIDLLASRPALPSRPPPPEVAAPAPGWQVASPPPGFRLRASRQHGAGVQLLYSDGLASVSVYVEPAGAGVSGVSSSRRGAVNARSTWADGWHVLAIGKVPPETVDRFARGLAPVLP